MENSLKAPFENEFTNAYDSQLADQFITQGYVILPVSSMEVLDKIQQLVVNVASKHLKIETDLPAIEFLNQIHHKITVQQLNTFRLAVINQMNAKSWLRPDYFQLAQQAIESLVGNELAMQRRVNLSIQLPQDSSSLLPIHADVWSGDSPFEMVVWLPLVDCRETKSMYILPAKHIEQLHQEFPSFEGQSSDAIFQSVQDKLLWIDIKYGEVLLFNQNLPHGNCVNQETETRWSMNCRFKSVFTPYADKKLGEFFQPITLRAMSRIGMNYRLPGDFSDE
ncbi:MAG: 2OG-Fe(II) oxygenase [Methylococcales bacterium]|jgi:sporadic carbohydrate cluster 2OG-Fe(II) oxygenase|nr:2OG-Fe(II) oxygenase [Methylococcales bacterium]MBT7408723.1 2OG-Fe(II) oxygenase [Methylococcales bacterium]